MMRAHAHPFIRTIVFLVVAELTTPPMVSQTQVSETQFISTVTAAINSLVGPLTGAAKSPIIHGGQLVFAHGSVIANAPLDVLLDYVDGLKASGVQRVEFNPGITSLSDPRIMAKYDAVVRHIRELGLLLAINPEVNPGEAGFKPTFQHFQDVALPGLQQLAARYQPDNFVIVHEPTTMAGRMGINTTVQDWHNFILAAAPLVKAASPHTRIGAGGYQGTTTPELSAAEATFFQDFVTIPELDFLTMDIYDIDAFPQFIQWAQMAHAAGKGVYIEETWAPQFLQKPLPPSALTPLGYLAKSLNDLAIMGPANADFAGMDISWLNAMAVFAAANGMESITPFTTQTFFAYGTAGHDKVNDATYVAATLQSIRTGHLTSTATAYAADSQQRGIKMASSVSSASYQLLTSVFSGSFGSSVIAPDELVSAFGDHLATTIAAAGSSNYPVDLGGTTITLLDSSNTKYKVSMYSVAPQQINYVIPSAVKPGPATLTITSADGVVTTGVILMTPVQPGLYTANANGNGPAAAIAVCAGTCAAWSGAQHANGQAFQKTFSCAGTPGSCVTTPIDLGGPADTVVVELYGTGLRHVSSLHNVSVQIHGQNAPVTYAGPQSAYPGLDQINVQVPRSLAGAGEVSLVLTAQDPAGQTSAVSNAVTLNIK